MTPEEIERELSELAGPVPSARTRRAILQRLETGIAPVEPLRAPWVRALAASLTGLAVSLGVAGAMGVRPMGISGIALFGMLAAFAFVASWLSMRSVVPGEVPPPSWRAFLIATPLFLAGVVVILAGTGGPLGPARCLNLGLVLAVLPWIPAAWLMRRGMAIVPSFAGACAGMAAGSWSLSMLHLTCPMLGGAHLLAWHGGLLLICTGLGLGFGKLVFRR